MNILKGIVCFLMTLLLIGCGADEPIYDKVIYDGNGNKYYARAKAPVAFALLATI